MECAGIGAVVQWRLWIDNWVEPASLHRHGSIAILNLRYLGGGGGTPHGVFDIYRAAPRWGPAAEGEALRTLQ